MNALAACAAVLLGAGLEVHLAPDQPLPHVYVGDPLIVEVKAPVGGTARLALTVRGVHLFAPTTASLEAAPLQAHGAYWWTVEDLPEGRGRYEVEVQVELDGATSTATGVFCRVDRPTPYDGLPVWVHLEGLDRHRLLALESLSVQGIRLDADVPGIEEGVKAISDAGTNVAIRLDADAAGRAEALARTLGNRVGRWEIVPGADAAALGQAVSALRRGGTRAPMAVVTSGPSHLAELLEAGAGQHAGAVVLERRALSLDEVVSLRAVAERAGYERMTITVPSKDAAGEAQAKDVPLIQRLLSNLADGVADTEIEGEQVLMEDGFPEAYVHLSAVSHGLNHGIAVGALDLPAPAHAAVFRHRDRWFVTLWTATGHQDVTIALEGASDLMLTDVRNNPLPIPLLRDGQMTLRAGPWPQTLNGYGGAVLPVAAWTMARKEARAFVEAHAGHGRLPPEVLEIVRTAGEIADAETPNVDRLGFFKLLQTFPDIEARWHARELPRAVAVPAMAGLARLARHLCVIEQERGEPFLEPLQDTLARCRDYQSSYLTGAPASADRRGRGDWLLGEVNRLMAEAEQLKAEGRTIEADAVAAMAEWRARALEHAAHAAPLHGPDPYVPPPEEPEESETGEGQDNSGDG